MHRHFVPIVATALLFSLLGATVVLAQGSLGSSLDPAVEAALADEAKRVPVPAAPKAAADEAVEAAGETIDVAPIPGEDGLVEGAVGEDAAAGGAEAAAAAAGVGSEVTPEDVVAVEEPVDDNPVNQSFRTFCREWMAKLAERERRNEGRIDWQAGESFVQGSYVGYTRDHTCAVDTADEKSPVGKISYLEIKYEKRGATESDALIDTPHPVETTEVTEFFRYGGDGEWIY